MGKQICNTGCYSSTLDVLLTSRYFMLNEERSEYYSNTSRPKISPYSEALCALNEIVDKHTVVLIMTETRCVSALFLFIYCYTRDVRPFANIEQVTHLLIAFMLLLRRGNIEYLSNNMPTKAEKTHTSTFLKTHTQNRSPKSTMFKATI